MSHRVLSPMFYHGSNHEFKTGDVVDPKFDPWGDNEAHATPNLDVARGYGEHTYQVEPIGSHYLAAAHEDDGRTLEHWSSNEGWRVKGRVK
jgi:hypothetical protein